MKRNILYAFLLISLQTVAQNTGNHRSEILAEIEKNNTSLATLRAKTAAALEENRIGNSLSDPKVGFSYAWGNRNDMANKKSVSVEQELDWATVTGLRNRSTRHKDTMATLNYGVQRQQLLAQADQLLVNLTFANAMCSEMQRRAERATKLKELYEKKYEIGEANQIELNKVRLNHTAAMANYRRTKTQQANTYDELKKLNGNMEIIFADTTYETAILPSLSELQERVGNAPQLLYAKTAIEQQKKEVQIARSKGLPSLSLGYSGEFVGNNNYNGINVGVSIPIWNNSRRKIRQQKSMLVASQLDQKDIEMQTRSTLAQDYEQAQQLLQIASQFQNELKNNEDIQLLYKALEAGKISLIDYLNELNFYNEAHTQALEAERDSQLAVSRLYYYFR